MSVAAPTRSEFDSPERQALREAARAFAEKEITPHVADYDREERFPAEIVRKTAELGWIGAVLPEEYGGQGLDWVSFAMLIEEISRACHVVGLAISMPSGLVGGGILRHGSDEQRQRLIPPLVHGQAFAGAGVTEPGSGTDVASMQTSCRREGDEYVINGAKAWISMLDVGSWFLTFATLDRSLGRQGVCAFVVPRETPGLVLRPYKNKLGFRPIATGDLILGDVRVPVENRIGEEGDGYSVAMTAVETGRLSVAARAVGLAQACLDSSVAYARERNVFGGPIARFQLVQSMITDMVVGIESARDFVYRLAAAKDAGVARPRRESSLAKMHATDVAMMASTHAVQIHGAYGVSEEFPVGRLFRDAKVFQIIEGTNQLHRALIGEYALGLRSD
ncbi:MAG TPA: acyl-CoA dehydrogenase family protein [Gaiellaceae bacterium]|nr:acyl-CoA dehydrogenase family protein [Gaiellaceae bacterium]